MLRIKLSRILLLLLIFAYSITVKASDSIPPKTVFSIGFAYLNTFRTYNTHVHNRYSPLDFNTDIRERSGSGAVGINMLRTIKPRFRLETGAYLAFNQYTAIQYNLVGYKKILDTVKAYYFDEYRAYKMARLIVPLKIIYHLNPKVYPWYGTAGFNAGRVFFENSVYVNSESVPNGIEIRDQFSNTITYHRYNLDYCGGIGKFIRLGPTVQCRIEGGYSRSLFSVLKGPDKGWLSAFYLQFGLISL